MNATQTKRYGRKEATPAVPKPNAGETQEAFLARCKTLNIADAEALKAFKAATPPAPPADPKASDNEMTIEQVTDIVTKAVADANAAGQKANITAEAIRVIIAEELAKQVTDSKKMTLEQVRTAAEAASKAVADANRKEAKNLRTASDADRGLIEIPFSLTKGNLPPHMKQLVNVLLKKDLNDGIDTPMRETAQRHANKFWDGIRSRGVKALTTSGDGTGAEWVPHDLTSELYRRLYLESALAQAFLAGEVQMPTNPYDYPLLTTDPVFKLNNVQNTNASPSDPGTSKFTLTAQRLMALCQFSYEADEDSLIPLLPVIQQTLARAAARALEQAFINGDDTATHFDTGETVATNDVRRAWKGLRKLATAASLTVDMATGVSRTNLLAMVKLMGKYGVRTQDLLWIVGTKAWASLLNLDEVALAYARGQTGSYIAGGPTPAPWGGSIIVSEEVAENLNANAIFDNSTTTKGQIIVMSRAGFVVGSRREFTVEVDKNIKSQTHEVVASVRKAFQPVETPSATISTVVVGRNYAA
jgi:HK97 family phage major capsid protein